MYEYPFEKLKIWQNGRDLAKTIYSVAGKAAASDKKDITCHLREAGVKITTSLSEGNWNNGGEKGRASIDRSHLHLMELLSLVIVAHDLGVLDDDSYSNLRSKINDLSIMLIAFKKSLERKAEKKVVERVEG